MTRRMQETATLMQAVGLLEEPFGIYYADEKPEGAFGPKEGPEISRRLENENKINWQDVFSHFSCVQGNVWLARKKKKAAFISHKEYGCPGGGIYTGFYPEYPRFIAGYVSTGTPGTPLTGERYMKSPGAMCKFLDTLAPLPAPARYCIFKPLSQFDGETQPEFVTLFARPEAMSGLATLLHFTTGDVDLIAAPFGAGCSHMVGWPRYYKAQGCERAVLGSFDPSARKFLKTDELYLTMPVELYDKALAAMPESHLHTRSWETVLKKIEKSNKAWGE